jgi:hypothetical protein
VFRASRYVGTIISLCLLGATFAVEMPGTSGGTGVRFRKVGGYLVVVRVTLDGKGPFDFVVDTGTNTTLIDVELAAQLKLKPVGRQMLATLTGSQLATRYVAGLALGSHSSGDLVVLAQKMDELHAVDRRIRGLLGLDFLLRFAFLLDYGRQRMELYDPTEAPNLEGGTRLPIKVAESRILITASSTASVQNSWNLVLDSGIPKVFIFENRIVPLHDSYTQDDAMRFKTNLSRLSTKTMTLPDLVIASRHLRDLLVVILPSSPSVQGSFEDGLLPAALFRRVLVNSQQGYSIFQVD